MRNFQHNVHVINRLCLPFRFKKLGFKEVVDVSVDDVHRNQDGGVGWNVVLTYYGIIADTAPDPDGNQSVNN